MPERAYLKELVIEASSKLASAQEPKRIAHLLRTIVDSMKTAGNMDIKALFAGYKIALDDVSGAILEQALIDFIKGNAAGYSPTFLPTPAEIRRYCEKITKFTQSQISYAQRLLDAPEELGKAKRVSHEQMKALMDKMGNTMGNVPANQTRH